MWTTLFRFEAAIGTNDTLASPGAQLDYYQALLDTMGRPAVDQFARLFVIPQAGHGLSGSVYGTNGEGKETTPAAMPSDYERFAYLVSWVERGVAPNKTLQVTAAGRTLPLCSYPAYPKYISGSPATAGLLLHLHRARLSAVQHLLCIAVLTTPVHA